jgi:manganese/zinc/iron transport system ATP- binding protein
MAAEVDEEVSRLDPSIPLQIRDLTVAYQQRPVLWEVNLDLPAGSLVGLVGPNGAGKSTLLRAILGLVEPISGEVRVFGKSLAEQRGRVAYVPQRESVDWEFPCSVLDLVLMGTYGKLGWFRRPGAVERARAMEALRAVEMDAYADRQIGRLSGGQQQRAFLARALVQQSDLYLLDEPFAAVDAATELAIMQLLRSLRAEGKTVVVVHHDLHTAPDYFDRVVLLNMRVVAYGKVEQVFQKENLQKTYGGRLTVLDELAEAMRRRGVGP